jgi:hypothetical protein
VQAARKGGDVLSASFLKIIMRTGFCGCKISSRKQVYLWMQNRNIISV